MNENQENNDLVKESLEDGEIILVDDEEYVVKKNHYDKEKFSALHDYDLIPVKEKKSVPVKVYARTINKDGTFLVTALLSSIFITPTENDFLIDQGFNDLYVHTAGYINEYLGGDLYIDMLIHKYKIEPLDEPIEYQDEGYEKIEFHLVETTEEERLSEREEYKESSSIIKTPSEKIEEVKSVATDAKDTADLALEATTETYSITNNSSQETQMALEALTDLYVEINKIKDELGLK